MTAADEIPTDPQKVVAAMVAAGFVTAGVDAYHTSLCHPDLADILVVPMDPTAPEYPQMMSGLLTQLRRTAEHGDRARRALTKIPGVNAGMGNAEYARRLAAALHAKLWQKDPARAGTASNARKIIHRELDVLSAEVWGDPTP